MASAWGRFGRSTPNESDLMNDEPLTKQLADTRAARRLSQEQAAREIGVSWTTFSRWERGKCAPNSMATLAAVRRWLAGEAVK